MIDWLIVSRFLILPNGYFSMYSVLRDMFLFRHVIVPEFLLYELHVRFSGNSGIFGYQYRLVVAFDSKHMVFENLPTGTGQFFLGLSFSESKEYCSSRLKGMSNICGVAMLVHIE